MRKHTKKQIIVILLLLFIAIISVYNFLKDKLYAQGATLSINSEGVESFITQISESQMIYDYKNIYNVAYLQQLGETNIAYSFEATAVAQIRGEKVTFTNFYSQSVDYTTKNITTTEGNTCIENNIMAAIASGAGVKNTGYKYADEDGKNYYSGEQLAIWEFWNTWVQNSGANLNGFEKGIGNGTITENGLNGETERKEAQECATQNTYNVNIYFLKYLAHNNNFLSVYNGLPMDNQANLILIERIDEMGEKIDSDIIEDSDIYISVTNNQSDVVQVGEEIEYTINVLNKSENEQENLILTSKLYDGIEFVEVSALEDEGERILKENKDYTFDKETRTLKINVDKIDGAVTETISEEDIDEVPEYKTMNGRSYKIRVKADKLVNGTYSRTVKNVVKVQKEGKVLTQKTSINTISDIYLEIEDLIENINGDGECTIGVKITNKGLIDKKNVSVKISVPEEILIGFYKESFLSETGEEEKVTNGTTSNEFDNNIDIYAQKTYYLQLSGTINETDLGKQITITGMVNDEEIHWTISLQKKSSNENNEIAKIDERRLFI